MRTSGNPASTVLEVVGPESMQIIEPAVTADIENGRLLRIDLGSGGGRREGYYGLDTLALDNVDIVADLNAPLDLLPDDSVGEIFSCHVLEHVENVVGLMEELHRVVHPSGTIKIMVPHFSNPYYYSDPTHVRFFGAYSMYYFANPEDQPAFRKVPAFYTKARFKVEQVTISLLNNSFVDRLMWPRLYDFINKNPARLDFYERRLCRFFPASGITYVLRPVEAA